MLKFLFFSLIIWIILKMINFISRIQLIRKNTPKKETKNHKSGMNILDADYEEVE